MCIQATQHGAFCDMQFVRSARGSRMREREQRALRTPSALPRIAVVQCQAGRGHGWGQRTRAIVETGVQILHECNPIRRADLGCRERPLN